MKNQSRFEVSQPRRPSEHRLDLGLEHQGEHHEGDHQQARNHEYAVVDVEAERPDVENDIVLTDLIIRTIGLTSPSGIIGSRFSVMECSLSVTSLPAVLVSYARNSRNFTEAQC